MKSLGRTPINAWGQWSNYMKTSANPWERLVFEKGLVGSPDVEDEYMKSKVYTDGSYVFLRHMEKVAYNLVNDEFYKNKPLPIFHVSKEKLRYVRCTVHELKVTNLKFFKLNIL